MSVLPLPTTGTGRAQQTRDKGRELSLYTSKGDYASTGQFLLGAARKLLDQRCSDWYLSPLLYYDLLIEPRER